MGLFDFWKKPEPKQRRQPRMRSYQAADTGRLVASWSKTPTSADAEIYASLRTVRARSRKERRDNPYISRYMGLLSANVVGPRGITMQAQARFGTGRPDTRVNDAIEAWWADWGKGCDISGTRNWLDVQRLAIQSLAEDGEVLIEKVQTKDGLKLYLIDPELLDLDHNEALPNGAYVRMGIEFSEDGEPQAYYLIREKRGSLVYGTGYTYAGRQYRRVPAERVMHIYLSDRVGQSRGMPWTASILWRLQMHHGYVDAAVTASRVGAAKMGFFSTPDGAPYTGETDADGATLMDSAEPGAFETLPDGMTFTPFNPDYPHAQFASFDKSMLRSHASGLNVSYNALANDLEGVNFSSIRAGVLEDRECWKALQEFLIDKLCRPVFEAALLADLAAGRVGLGSGSASVVDFDKYKRVMWQGRRWAWVDPLKDLQTAKLAYEMNATSISAIIRDMGKDPEEVWREIQREKQVMAQYGVTPAEAMAAIQTEAEAQASGGEDEDARGVADAYGIAVRAGMVTPQSEDEAHFRSMAGLPPMSSLAEDAWDVEGVRRPITLTAPESGAPTAAIEDAASDSEAASEEQDDE